MQCSSQSATLALAQVFLSHSRTRNGKDMVGIVSNIVETTLCIRQSPNYVFHNEIEHINLHHDRLTHLALTFETVPLPLLLYYHTLINLFINYSVAD